MPSPQSLTSITIPLNLKIHAEARSVEEVWSGKTNSYARRKLQNRLNQRAHRRRLAKEKASKIHVFEVIPTAQSDVERAILSISMEDTSADNATWSAALRKKLIASPLPLSASWCRIFEWVLAQEEGEQIIREDQLPGEVDTNTVSFEEGFLEHLGAADFYELPGDDHLLSLMYYNVFRALTSNVRALGLDTVLMHTNSYPSPFIAGTTKISTIPPGLRPTKLQSTVPHHPCFDIFPDPVVRDNGIRQTALLPHGKLCMTLAGRNTWFQNERSKRNGLIVWGPPEDATSWEVTEGFVKNWGWLVKGSYMLECSTNRWRWARGEPAIFFA